MFVGEDDTLFFREGARTALSGLHETVPYFISGKLVKVTLLSNLKPAQLPCLYLYTRSSECPLTVLAPTLCDADQHHGA